MSIRILATFNGVISDSLTQCELAGHPADESHMIHVYDSRSKTETATHAEHCPIFAF